MSETMQESKVAKLIEKASEGFFELICDGCNYKVQDMSEKIFSNGAYTFCESCLIENYKENM